MNGASEHPYCAVVVTLIPLSEDGQPDMRSTVTLSGVGGPVSVEMDDLTIKWRPDRYGSRFVIAGSQEWL